MQEMTMVEKVARSIARRRAIRLLEAAGSDERHIKEFTVIISDMDDARAAIEAMREPTDAMLFASYRNGASNGEFARIAKGYTAMIGAALSE